MSEGINEIMDVLDAVEVALDQAKEALKDGKIGISDIPLLFAMFGPVSEAVKGLDKVVAEATDIDADEASKLGQKAFVLATKIAALFTK